MKVRVRVFGILLWAAATAYAQSPPQIFDQANQLYQQGKFVEAGSSYESLIANGYASGELYYNLGNAYYKSGNIAKAVLNYERALRLMPNDEDLRYNLQLANLMITDKIEATPRLFIWDYWDAVRNAFSLRGITWLAYLLYVLAICCWAGVILAKSYRVRKIAFFAGMAGALVFVLVLVLFLAKVIDLGRTDYAVVTADITTLKNSPDQKSSDAFVLHRGVKVRITDRLNNWFQIRLVDGKVGWMENNDAEII